MKANPIVWWELASHDAEKTADFLKKVFGWEIEYDETIKCFDFPIPKDSRNLSGGGVFTLRKAKLPFLTFYVQVENIDKKIKLIEQLGGYILEAPFEIPSGSRICLFNEPSGVTLAMLEKKKS